jgi:hypothetical protein
VSLRGIRHRDCPKSVCPLPAAPTPHSREWAIRLAPLGQQICPVVSPVRRVPFGVYKRHISLLAHLPQYLLFVLYEVFVAISQKGAFYQIVKKSRILPYKMFKKKRYSCVKKRVTLPASTTEPKKIEKVEI